MFNLSQEFILEDKTFYKVESVELISSRETNSDTLIVQFPRWNGFSKSKLEKGMKVEWKAGYKETGLVSEFSGVITEISSKETTKIICRDKLYELQNQTMKRNLSGSLQKCIPEIYPDFQIQEGLSANLNIQSYNRSKAWALRQLQTQGIDSFFRFGKLQIQKPALLSVKEDILKFEKGFNIIDDEVSLRMNRPVMVKLLSYDPSQGTYSTGVFGQKGGEEKVFELDGIPSKDITKRAEQIFKEIAGIGLKGNFLTFGHPSVKHSEIIWFRDPKEPDRNKAAFVTKVEKNFNFSGASYRQRIHLDIVEFQINNFKELPDKYKKQIANPTKTKGKKK
jgi:hypothetical protein